MIGKEVILFVILAILFSVSTKLLFRHVLKKVDPYAFAWINQLISSLIFLPIALWKFSLSTNIKSWIFLLIAAGIWSLSSYITNLSYKHTEVSTREPIGQTKMFWVLLLGILFLGEKADLYRILGTFLIFFGIGVLIWHPEKKFNRFNEKGVIWSILAAFILAMAVVADKFLLHFFNPEVYGFLVFFIPFIILSFFLKGKSLAIKEMFKHRAVSLVLAIFSSVIGYYFTLKAFSVADVTLIYPLLQLTILITVLGGIFIMKEKTNIWQKIIAGIIVLIGTLLIGR